VEFNTLSKSHNMAGWRVGAAVGHPQALKALFRLKTNLDSGHFLPILRGAIAAMDGDQGWIAGRNDIYRQRRDLLVEGLRAAGLDPFVPAAAIYVWCPVPKGWTSMDFTTFLLEKAHISLTPGTVFGGQGEGYVRFALTASIERTAAAAERLLRVKDQMMMGRKS
jgi:LL-diaminopimelate aminotransferase